MECFHVCLGWWVLSAHWIDALLLACRNHAQIQVSRETAKRRSSGQETALYACTGLTSPSMHRKKRRPLSRRSIQYIESRKAFSVD
ncbi:hypothetical protein M408DRAFT_256938 [Serendipita vermifera MAFF 305830]|uniref:Secreted protein n=1 Tax=Serendipita vermifera MAFF 305830 TaxID=933852 RepID=A0A0C2XQQ2_SERVB|nr:hypothetical protein M408DRAFT_256938 [Serendipita vermifera MAFF 305830]